MGKAGRNEAKRVAANFLSGIAVALIVAGCIGPLLAGEERVWLPVSALIASAAMHWMAQMFASDLED